MVLRTVASLQRRMPRLADDMYAASPAGTTVNLRSFFLNALSAVSSCGRVVLSRRFPQ